MGYNSFAGAAAETTVEEDSEELHAAATHFAEASNAAQQTFRELTQANTALQGELSALRQQFDALQANATMQNYHQVPNNTATAHGY